MSCTKEEIVETISKMSLIEINELVSMIEKKFSVLLKKESENTDDNLLPEKNKEKIEFNVTLKSIGKNKISLIKNIRAINNLGLKEAKDLVESCPVIIKEKINKEESEKIKKILEELGAEIEIN